MSERQPATSWRDALSIHPAAELFPLMGGEELRALGQDIRKHGLRSPIVLWRADPRGQAVLLDGRNRLDAIEMVIGAPFVFGPPSLEGKNFLAPNKVIVLEKSVDPYAYVVSANIHRRHLTAEQKRDLIGKLLKADPSKSDRQIAQTVKADHKTVGAVRAKQEARGGIPHVSTRTDSKGRAQPAKKIKTAPTPEIIGPDSAAELERLRAHNAELENKVRRLEIENAGLRSEVDELKADLAKRPPLAADDPGPIPAFLRRGVKP